MRSAAPHCMVPAEFGGLGASLLDAVRVQRAVGSRSPSLAVATTMHHFSVASLVELHRKRRRIRVGDADGDRGADAGCSAPGSPRAGPGSTSWRRGCAPSPVDGGLKVSGVKKPCSLTWSMDLMSASVAVADPDGGPDRLAVVLIPAESEGIERSRFWQSAALAGAESDQVTLTDVFVPEALVFYPDDGPTMDPIQARGFVWFELLVSASYLGAAPPARRERHQARQGVRRGPGDARHRAGVRGCGPGARGRFRRRVRRTNDDLLARALYARYATERTIERVVMSAAATAGGMAFIESSEVAYLLGATRALAFHPPSRAAAQQLSGPLPRRLRSQPLTRRKD